MCGHTISAWTTPLTHVRLLSLGCPEKVAIPCKLGTGDGGYENFGKDMSSIGTRQSHAPNCTAVRWQNVLQDQQISIQPALQQGDVIQLMLDTQICVLCAGTFALFWYS